MFNSADPVNILLSSLTEKAYVGSLTNLIAFGKAAYIMPFTISPA